MSLCTDTGSLRSHLMQLAEEFDPDFNKRYELLFWVPEVPPLSERFRQEIVRLLRWLRLKPTPPPSPPPPEPPLEPWLTELDYVDYEQTARPVLFWAVGMERDSLRDACLRLRALQLKSPGWAPVLLTDVADFAFYSRLNWLVEYVPSLSAPADAYSRRKLCYLASRYRDLPALPLNVDFEADELLEDLLIE